MYIKGRVSKFSDGLEVEREREISQSCGMGSEQPCHSGVFGEMGTTGGG